MSYVLNLPSQVVSSLRIISRASSRFSIQFTFMYNKGAITVIVSIGNNNYSINTFGADGGVDSGRHDEESMMDLSDRYSLLASYTGS